VQSTLTTGTPSSVFHVRGQRRRDAVVDVTELGVPVGVLGAFEGLGVGLQAVTGLVQQPSHERRRHLMSLLTQLVSQAPQRLGRPPQRGHRVPARLGFDQLVQRRGQLRVVVLGPFPPSARAARAADRQRLRIIQLGASPAHGVRRDTDHVGDDPHSTRTQLAGLAAQPHPALTLGQMRLDRVVATDQRLGHRGHSTKP